MVEDYPDIVREIASEGHEIGVHGYEHDNLSIYDAEALALLDKNLARVGSLIEDITGSRPQGFGRRTVGAALLPGRGVRDAPCPGIPLGVKPGDPIPAELLRRGWPLVRRAWRASDGLARLADDRLLLGLLNLGLIAKGNFGGSPAGRLRWLLGQRQPFVRDGLTEVPVYAPLDCDLLGLPKPTDETPPETLEYARAVVCAAAAAPAGCQ